MVAEANRQFTLCNACRYCEGLCSVFPAMEMRTAFEKGDIGYLAHLCHDCRACLDVCPFSAPHEYAIDIPALMSTARVATFEELAVPSALWRILTRPWAALAAVGLGIAFYLTVALATGDPSRIVSSHPERASFYHVIAYLWLVIPAAVVTVTGLAVVATGLVRFSEGSPGGSRRLLLSGRAHIRAGIDALGLKNLRGGGGGCHYPGDRVSTIRAWLHHFVFYGFASMFVATISAAFAQEALGNKPPYALLSVPVVLGTVGGVATIAGCLGFIALGLQRRDERKLSDVRTFDRIFTVMLLAATATGLLTLAIRSTELMGPVLIVHLGTVGGLFLTLPYSKLVHGAYRYLALVRSHVEVEADVRDQPAPSPALVANVLLDPAGNLEG